MKQPSNDDLAIASTIARWVRRGKGARWMVIQRRRTMRIYTRTEIESFVLKSQLLKIEAYKQARQALEKPFSV